MTQQLLGLRAENYKRLELVNIEFPADGGAFAIMGQNMAGKTSALDALEATIAGKKGPKADAPVNIPSGADKSRIVATFDDIVVTRVFRKDGGTTIAVKNAAGVNVADPAKLLEKLYSHVALDPLAFSRLDDKTQVNTLLPLIGFDPAPLEAQRKQVFDERTAKGVEVRSLKPRLEAFADPRPGLPAAEISIAELSEELSRRERANAALVELGAEVTRRVNAVTTLEVSVESLRTQLAAEEERLAAARDALVQSQEAVEGTEVQDADGIREQIQTAETTNAEIRAEAQRKLVAAELKTAEDAYAAFTAKLDELAASKARALGEAKMPVPGLAIEGDEDPILTLNGVPFSQASTGEQIKTGTAIAMALNPNLKLVIIRDASLLDATNRQIIDRLAKDNGFLVLMEIADESSEVGVIIEAGLVREVRTGGESA